MGLLTTIRKQRRKEKEIRILLLGLDNAGKTTIVKQLLKQDVKEVSPTVGFSIQMLEWTGGFKLNIWDVGGQKSLRPFWRNYFEKTDFLIWTIDVNALDRLDDCKSELYQVLNEDRLIGCGVLIFVNKMDTISDADQRETLLKQIKSKLGLDDIIGNHNCRIMGCSALTGWNITEGIDWAVKEVSNRIYLID